MFRSQLYCRLSLAAAAVAFFAVAGCKHEANSEAASQEPQNQPAPAKQAKASAPAKPAAPKVAASNPTVAKPAIANKAATPKPVAVSAKTTQPAQLIDMTVPKGTAITAIIGQTLASDKNHPGDSFVASLSAPIEVEGKIVLPKGAHVTGRVVTIKKHELKVTLASVVVHGKSYDLATNSVRPSDKSQHKSNANGTEAANDNPDKTNGQKPKKDNSTLSAKTQLTFKLAKPVTVPVKG